jgi:CheY-like chemotaxis protein
MDQLKVLIVDDNKAQGEGLAELLKLKGLTSFYAASGVEGMQLASSQAVDAVLLDIHLPDMSGFEVCRLLRAEPATANVAIIFHSGSSGPLYHHGDAFLTYPVSFSELVTVIQGCVTRRRATVSA